MPAAALHKQCGVLAVKCEVELAAARLGAI